MTLSELAALLDAYLDHNPDAARLPVRLCEVGYPEHVQALTGDNPSMEFEDGSFYVVLTTREP
ncbi:hypothetical protein ACFQZ2_01670 [Streptomonospora algeriensis]|uniref:Uncharacterized protein n=1 Tax=Streptomonospora algeriensis TaxID=995084 RepID=A0ABW3BC02_9ACTN